VTKTKRDCEGGKKKTPPPCLGKNAGTLVGESPRKKEEKEEIPDQRFSSVAERGGKRKAHLPRGKGGGQP